MTTWGVSVVKDEADIIEGTIRHMAGEVDALLVMDNGSTDGTREILHQLATELPLTVVDDPSGTFGQAAKMTELADKAHAQGAQWIVPFDADELWWGENRIADVLAAMHYKATVTLAGLHDHVASADDLDDPDPLRAMVWRRREPQKLGKVAIRWMSGCAIRDGNHSVGHPRGERGDWALSICHFPYRSLTQFRRKAAKGAVAYVGADVPEGVGEHWRSYGRLLDRYGEGVLEQIWLRYRYELAPSDAGLMREVPPYRRWE